MKTFSTKPAPHRPCPAPRARTDHRATEGDFLGHPRGLTFLFTTEMWERFSYYGMRALLVLYMVKHLLTIESGNLSHNEAVIWWMPAICDFLQLFWSALE